MVEGKENGGVGVDSWNDTPLRMFFAFLSRGVVLPFRPSPFSLLLLLKHR